MTQWSPVFLGGLAHSGKTPLRIALEANPRISMTRKTYLWRRYYDKYGDLSDPKNLGAILEAMERDTDLDQLSPDFSRISAEFREGPATYCHLFGLLHAHHAERLGKPRWGDQQGLIEGFADTIFDSWPDARMVHLIRDPRDQAPMRTVHSGGRLGWFTAKWAESADLALSNLDRYRGRYRIIRYEDLAADPEGTIGGVCAFIGEEYVPDMVDAVGDLRHATSSTPDRRLRPGAIDFVEACVGDRMKRLGYRVRSDGGGGWASVRPVGLLGIAAWRIVGSRKAALS